MSTASCTASCTVYHLTVHSNPATSPAINTYSTGTATVSVSDTSLRMRYNVHILIRLAGISMYNNTLATYHGALDVGLLRGLDECESTEVDVFAMSSPNSWEGCRAAKGASTTAVPAAVALECCGDAVLWLVEPEMAGSQRGKDGRAVGPNTGIARDKCTRTAIRTNIMPVCG